MHRNERYFDKNEGQHNHFGQLEENDPVDVIETKPADDSNNETVKKPTKRDSDP